MKFKFLSALFVLSFIVTCIVNRPSLPEREQSQTVLVETESGWGSAVTVKRGGMCFAWTAAHVVDKYAKVKVHRIFRYRGKKAGDLVCNAHVIKVLPKQDAALLVIDCDPAQFKDATFSHDTGKSGDRITHVGNIFGTNFDTSFESGVVSQVGVEIDKEDCLLDQGSFPVAPGSSGGPVFNSHGDVIGIAVVYVGPGVSLYVPIRVLETAADNAGFYWALYGYFRVSEDFIFKMVEIREKEIETKPPENILQFLFGAPPEKK